ncbi:MAG: glucose 1-dehydrogenase [bacterium]|nr:glucose 1-dehydrogenase [bacterium]
MIDFTNKVALVTGAASGIGRACALTFARFGARLLVVDEDSDGGAETMDMARALGAEADFVSTDVSRSDEVETMADFALTRLGGIDIAVNAAGIPGRMASTIDADEADFDRVTAVNIRGVWLCMRAQLRQMRDKGGGAIVNIASAGGLVAAPGLPAYCASKHGVIGLTRTAAIEYGKSNIRINAVCPGGVLTPMMEYAIKDPERAARILAGPMGRLAQPQEIADAAAWLCSDRSSFVTGVALPVDGGVTAI